MVGTLLLGVVDLVGGRREKEREREEERGGRGGKRENERWRERITLADTDCTTNIELDYQLVGSSKDKVRSIPGYMYNVMPLNHMYLNLSDHCDALHSKRS